MVRGRTTGRGRGRGAATAANTDSDSTAAPTPSSSTPQPTPAANPVASTRGRGAASARATRGPTARFRPKNIRRDAEERDALAREEEKKANERAADAARARGRSRLRSKRSRGDAMGSRGGRQMTASGPFSAGFASSSGGRGGGGGWGGGGGGGGSGGGAWGGGEGFASRASKGGKDFNVTDGSANLEARINADKLHHANATSPDDEFDSDDEAMRATLSSRGATIIPMGIYRREHKEQEVIVATTAELEAAEALGKPVGEEESLFVVDSSSGDSTPAVVAGDEQAREDEGPTEVKAEPGEGEADLMEIDEKPAVEDKPKEEIVKKMKAVPADPEERAIQSDLAMLADELGAVTVTDDGEDAVASKDGRLYLFQFPPLLPPLKSIPPKNPQNGVKAEPSDDTNMGDFSNNNGEPVDLTAEQPDEALDIDEDPEMEKGFMSSLLNRGGMVGKLNVRKSGRVELDWGGTPLELSPATAMNFLTTAVIVEENDEKPGSEGMGGDSIGMGKVMGRFVLAPVWPEEEEYEIPEGVTAEGTL